MGDVAVENPSNNVPPHKKAAPSTIPHIDTFEGVATDGGDDYATLKKLQRGLEYDLTYHIATTTVLMLNI
jgi:26S proteasome regulatory subunit T3